MGTIGKKIAKSLKEETNQSQSSPHDDYDELKETELENLLQEMIVAPTQLIDEGYDPLYAFYMSTESLLGMFTQMLPETSEIDEHFESIDSAEEEYMPSYPPMSPVTQSFFNTWAQYDVRLESENETIATCVLEIADQIGLPVEFQNAIRLLQDTRMGVYEHCGFNGELVSLQELITGDTFQCHNPSGYQGKKGELWLARVSPSIAGISDHDLIYITPYILRDFSKQDWIAYLERSIAESEIDDERDALYDFMKYGDYPEMWLDYIMDGYSGFQDDAIFLTGIPDIEESLPHSLENGNFGMVPSTEEVKPSTKRNNLFFDNSKSMNNLVAVSERDEILAEYKQLRSDGNDIDFILSQRVTEEMIQESARKIDTLKYEDIEDLSDEEFSVLMDYCMYHVYRDGLNTIEQYFADTSPPEDSFEYDFLFASKHSFYSLFEVTSVQPEFGVTLLDIYSGESIQIVDIGMSMTAPVGMLVATRIKTFGNYSATGGCAIPLFGITKEGKKSLIDKLNLMNKLGKHGQIDPAPLIRECLAIGNMSRIVQIDPFESVKMQMADRLTSLGISTMQPPSVRKVTKRNALNKSTGEVIRLSPKKIGRNDPCPCGSNKKYKKCCLKK